MQPSVRDKRVRIGAGLASMALAALSVFMVFGSGYGRGSDIPLGFLYGLYALCVFGAGFYLAAGRGKASAMVLLPHRGRQIGLGAVALVGVSAVVFGFTAGPEALVTTALWPNMVGFWILLQFRTMSERFGHTEQWTTGLPLAGPLESLSGAFHQPGLSTTTVGQDVWVKIGREWTGGTWFHKDAARYIKSVIGIHFQLDEIDGETRITARSGDRTVTGMYDVLKLADEMSTTAVEIARQVTTHHLDGPEP
ncbi:hypothetical protein MB46_07285 [Arthrobacter alpinus]|uniref:hypothetical protein n=1 Tax=Arthrobacter alpinus TaxID=656366 RepID=UPI0005CAE02E|nr:hypothetical protein [Arthrobacter alpinus]ALV45323.1 hypothetical protein MB46_07285 [Arthrobacter alpinus]